MNYDRFGYWGVFLAPGAKSRVIVRPCALDGEALEYDKYGRTEHKVYTLKVAAVALADRMNGKPLTIWTVEKDARGWSVVAERDGERVEPRRSLTGLACITAQVLAEELNRAWRQGVADGADVYRRTLALETLGD